MERAVTGGVSIAYEAAGNPGDPTVVLINGLGQQLVWWPMGFIHSIAIAGHHVVRFDNRDVGLSTHFAGKPKLSGLREATAAGRHVDVPYRISDMAEDVRGLLDHLSVPHAHVVGVSMGGIIAQRLAFDHPGRVTSLCGVMTTTGDPSVGGWTARGRRSIFHAPPRDPAAAVGSILDSWELLAPFGMFDRAAAAITARWQIDRAFDPAGVGRQLAAIWAEPDRTPDLRTLELPTLVVHGSEDPLISVTGGRAIATAVPGSTYVEIEGMGHELAPRHWPEILAPLLDHLATEEQQG